MTAAHAAAAVTLADLPGGVCATPGVAAAGIAAGIKPQGVLDVALVAAPRSVAAGAVQTRNQVTAAPVQLTRRHLVDGRARAVLLNSGNANACTGGAGMRAARASAAAVGDALRCPAEDVLVCSTGVIGVPLPAGVLPAAVPRAAGALSPDGGDAAAAAILTTDTVPKQVALRARDDRGSCVVGGMAKGSGMIAPGMATMLAVLTTDAPLEGDALDGALREATARTFERICVDGCMSTNDAVVLLATGDATRPPRPETVAAALEETSARLAEAIVRDGEGARHLVRLRVRGARSEDDALGVARAVADSVLFRTAIAGGDPNWGRVLAAIGAGRVPIDPDRIAVAFGDVAVCCDGVAVPFDRDRVVAALGRRDVAVDVDLGVGEAEATLLTADLTHDYVTINAEYTT